MTITADAPALLHVVLPVEAPLCDHAGCRSGEPATAGPLFAGEDLGGPRRPVSWGGNGPGLADLDGQACPAGLDHCCGRCGCQDR
jgi:hypothetical protein